MEERVNDPGKEALEDIVGKGENAVTSILLQQCFLPDSRKKS